MKDMLQSVMNQRRLPDECLISVSYSEPVTRNMVDELTCGTEFVTWFVHDQPMTQFGHYVHIYCHDLDRDLDHDRIITFVDDDDLLHPERLSLGCQIPDGYDGTICKYSNDMSLVDQPVTETSATEYVYEYVCCALRWEVVDEIFSMRDDPLLSMINLSHPHCDWQFLHCVMTKYEINYIDSVLYMYRLRS